MVLSLTFQALADPSRQKVIELLKIRDMTAGEIGKNFTISSPTLSHHLNILKQAGLIICQRHGQEKIYSLNLSVFEEVAGSLINFFKQQTK